jgi:hypothetical protein
MFNFHVYMAVARAVCMACGVPDMAWQRKGTTVLLSLTTLHA